VRILWGKYGENGIVKEFTDVNISQVKKEVVKIVENHIKDGILFYY
jgi:hypothetical protein